MRPIPDHLSTGPFHRSTALSSGIAPRVLEGTRFVRVLPSVYRRREHEMTDDDWVLAARLALPEHAHLTGITRIQQLGLDFGPRRPVRFVVEGDLHLAYVEIFLHRTKRLPPTDDVGVTPAAAFIAYCRRARVLDAIEVGDWLLHHDHMSRPELRGLALAEQWRDGADEALWVLEHLDARARSLKESETRAVLRFAGLPAPEVNRRLPIVDDVTIIGDLVYREWSTVVEYEGKHHQEDRPQHVADLDRYGILRRHDVGYVQMIHEKLGQPRSLAGEVFRELVSRGYEGPPPSFGHHWRTLFQRITDVLGPRRDRAVARRGHRAVH